jgi:hypothetical protein
VAVAERDVDFVLVALKRNAVAQAFGLHHT